MHKQTTVLENTDTHARTHTQLKKTTTKKKNGGSGSAADCAIRVIHSSDVLQRWRLGCYSRRPLRSQGTTSVLLLAISFLWICFGLSSCFFSPLLLCSWELTFTGSGFLKILCLFARWIQQWIRILRSLFKYILIQLNLNMH